MTNLGKLACGLCVAAAALTTGCTSCHKSSCNRCGPTVAAFPPAAPCPCPTGTCGQGVPAVSAAPAPVQAYSPAVIPNSYTR